MPRSSPLPERHHGRGTRSTKTGSNSRKLRILAQRMGVTYKDSEHDHEHKEDK